MRFSSIMSRQQIFAQKEVVIDSEQIRVFGKNDLSFSFNGKPVLTTVSNNTSVGLDALPSLTTGSGNIAVGLLSGSAYTSTESNNILIDNHGVVADQNTIRIGDGTQVLCFISGIHGVTSAGASAAVINSAGKLGTVVSSRKRKRDELSIDKEDLDKLYLLKPKKFKMIDDKTDEQHYGFIAEEVQQEMPELVVLDEKGEPATVQYQKLYGLLHAAILSHQSQINDLQQKILSQQK